MGAAPSQPPHPSPTFQPSNNNNNSNKPAGDAGQKESQSQPQSQSQSQPQSQPQPKKSGVKEIKKSLKMSKKPPTSSRTHANAKDNAQDRERAVVVRRAWNRVSIARPNKIADVFYFESNGDRSRLQWRLSRDSPEAFASGLSTSAFLSGEFKQTHVTVYVQVSNFDLRADKTVFISTDFSSRSGFTLPAMLACIRDAAVAAAVAAIREQNGFNVVRQGEVQDYLANRVVPKLYVIPKRPRDLGGAVYVPILVQHASRRT